MTDNRELTDVEDGPAYRVGKASLGLVRDFPIAEHFSLGGGRPVFGQFRARRARAFYGGTQSDRRDGIRPAEAEVSKPLIMKAATDSC